MKFKVGDKVKVSETLRELWDDSIKDKSWGVLYDSSNTFFILILDTPQGEWDSQNRYVIGIMDSVEASETLHKIDGGDPFQKFDYKHMYGFFTGDWFTKVE